MKNNVTNKTPLFETFEGGCDYSGIKRITLCFDLDTKKDAPDEPNFAARHEHLMKTIHTIKDIDPSFEEIYIASFDRPCDPDEYIHSEGAEAFCTLIAEAEPWWKYAYGYYSKL